MRRKSDLPGVNSLSPTQRQLIGSLVAELSAIDGVRTIVLGGSFARGRARPDSDIDLGVLYEDNDPFKIEVLRNLAVRLNDHPKPVVTEFYEWGRWVNGGAWLTTQGQRVDVLYRSLQQFERVIADAEAGRYEIDYEQQPPFGFFGPTYLGEVSTCQVLFDPKGFLDRLKERVAAYPEALGLAVVRDCLWSVEFGLHAFAPKFALAGDVYGTIGCLARFANRLVLALFALNRVYFVNDKTAIAEIGEFKYVPSLFGDRLQSILSRPGSSPAELSSAVESMSRISREVVALSDGLYEARYRMP
jgi:predicted nucleotidyltransferase